MKKYVKEFILVLFILAILGLSFIQYQYATIGLYVAKIQFQEQLSEAFEVIHNDLSFQNELTFLMLNAIRKSDDHFNLSADSLTSAASTYLYDFLMDRMLGAGIKTKFGYSLNVPNYQDSVLFFYPERHPGRNISTTMEVDGYLVDAMGIPLQLRFDFYALGSYYFQKLNKVIIPGILFVLIIIAVVVWVFNRTFYQSRIILNTNRFINNLTHELKTPVFSIGIATKLLEEERKDNHPALEHIKMQNDRLKEQIEKVLSLAEMESKGYIMRLSDRNITPMIEALCKEYNLKARIEDFQFFCEIEERIIVNADEFYLKNALVNLLENAKIHGGYGKITFSVKERPLAYEFRIEDNGPGIPAKYQSRIFNRYFRIQGANDPYKSGYGLGLHFTKQVVKFHKGRIKLTSVPDQGTSVVITLPKIKRKKD